MNVPRLFTRLGRLKIAAADGTATQAFSLYDQKRCEAIEQAIAGLQDQLSAIQAAQAAATAANEAAEVAEAAAESAQSAASAATDAATAANDTIAEIAAGTLDLDAVKIGGTRFVNDGSGNLVPEP